MSNEITSINLDQHLARGGPAALIFAQLWEKLWQQSHIAPPLLELCRLTFARMHGDAPEMAAQNLLVTSDGKHSALKEAARQGRLLDDPGLPKGWSSVLLFAEYYWTDVQSLPDEVAQAVKLEFGEPAFVTLIEALGCIDGRIRTARCLRDMIAHQAKKVTAHVC